MGVPVSLPLNRPQPFNNSYGVEWLTLFETVTRQTYREAFGVEAPWWDPTRPRKDWFDSSVDLSDPARLVQYSEIEQGSDGSWGLVQFSMSAMDASTVNLPGAKKYAPNLIAPTGAIRGGTPVLPLYLSLESDARALMAITGALELINDGASAMYPVLYPPGEARRMWALRYAAGGQVNVGALLQSRFEKGLDSPGKWDMSSGYPVWVADAPAAEGFDDPRPAVPIPVRNLMENEALKPIMTALGPMGVEVVRKDLEIDQQAARGWFTREDRRLLAEVHQGIGQLLKRLT